MFQHIIHNLAFGLKSDHFGIEIDGAKRMNTWLKKLKSDHFGIEIHNFQLLHYD